MREILFRGKTDNGKWVEGFYYKDLTSNCVYIISWKNANVLDVENFVEVTTETIGQYTGLTDKNGKKIFEGDIVKLHLIDCIEIGVIKYNDIMCRFMFFTKDGSYGFDNTNDFEVIGNIHDNPELLKGGAE